MNRAEVTRFALRVALAWSLLTVAGMFGAAALIKLLVPFLTLINEILAGDYTPLLDLRTVDDEVQLTLTAYFNLPVYVHSGLTLQPGAKITAETGVLHCLVPLTLLFTALSAWPAPTPSARVRYLGGGMLMAFPVLALTIPIVLAGKVEMLLVGHAAQAGEVYPHTFLLDWMLFNESGGIWLIPLVGAVLCAVLTDRRRSTNGDVAAERKIHGAEDTQPRP